MSEKVTRQDTAEGLCTLTLNRPEKLNALDGGIFEALDAHLTDLEKDDHVGCVVLRGAGRAFCTGADLTAVTDTSKRSDKPMNYNPDIITRLAKLRQPTIAAIHGVCFTGGLELAMGCDFLIADATAKFADTHGKWGFVGMWGMSQRLPRRVGIPAAKRMTLTSRIVDAEEALEIGLIDALAPEGQLDGVLQTFAAEILRNSWFTNIEAKRLMLATEDMTLADGLAYEFANHPGMAPDYLERVGKFTKNK